jgi:serine/threonine-protein kinase
VPPSLENIVLRCLDKNPERRFQTAGDLASALTAFLGDGAETYRYATLEPSTSGVPQGRGSSKNLMTLDEPGDAMGASAMGMARSVPGSSASRSGTMKSAPDPTVNPTAATLISSESGAVSAPATGTAPPATEPRRGDGTLASSKASGGRKTALVLTLAAMGVGAAFFAVNGLRMGGRGVGIPPEVAPPAPATPVVASVPEPRVAAPAPDIAAPASASATAPLLSASAGILPRVAPPQARRRAEPVKPPAHSEPVHANPKPPSDIRLER